MNKKAGCLSMIFYILFIKVYIRYLFVLVTFKSYPFNPKNNIDIHFANFLLKKTCFEFSSNKKGMICIVGIIKIRKKLR